MKKEESLWELLKRLDEQAGQFNVHMSEANRYFDTAAKRTKGVLDNHENEINKTIREVRKALKGFIKQKSKKNKKKE